MYKKKKEKMFTLIKLVFLLILLLIIFNMSIYFYFLKMLSLTKDNHIGVGRVVTLRRSKPHDDSIPLFM